MNILENLTVEKQKIVAEAMKIYTTADDDVKAAIAKGTSWAERHFWKAAFVFLAVGWIFGRGHLPF